MIELQRFTPLSEEAEMGAEEYLSISSDDSGDESDGPAPRCTIRCNECKSRNSFRVHAAFWLLGLCNNFGYVIMLSAAHDILKDEETNAESRNDTATTAAPGVTSAYPSTTGNYSASNRSCDQLECNAESTATVLLADILPTLLIKITAPYFMHRIPFNVRVALCVLSAIASYVLVAFAHVIALSYLGVVFASVGAGLGEITFLSLTAHYTATTVSYWSSGTGAAGAVGAWAYALLRLGLSSRNTLLVCNVIPVLMAVSYWGILPKVPSVVRYDVSDDALLDRNNDPNHTESDSNVPDDGGDPSAPQTSVLPRRTKKTKKKKPPGSSANMTLREKLSLLPPLLKYMVPLFFVYYAEYVINQGLYELMIWRGCIFLKPGGQYRWFQATYQIGVFISRSSVQILPFKRIWILSLLQVANVGLLFAETYWHIFPTIAISFVVIFYEGLLGGGCYVNAFSRIRKEVEPRYCEFSLGLASVADSFGITMAGATAIPLHNSLCKVLQAT